MYDYEGSRESNSLPMRCGDTMNVFKYSDTRDWAYVCLNGENTWEPVSYLDITKKKRGSGSGSGRPKSTHNVSLNPSVSGTSSTVTSGGSAVKRRALVIADFEGVDRSELSVHKGELVMVSREEGEWLLGEVGSRVMIGCLR